MIRHKDPRQSNILTRNKIQQILDSDDEYPDLSSDELEECIETPAYLIEERFDAKIETTNNPNDALKNIQMTFYLKMKQQKKLTIERCILTKRDMICLRAVEPCLSDAVFLWFLNYIKHRDMHKCYQNHFVSCLVPELYYKAKSADIEEMPQFKKKHNFKIIDVGRF